MSLRVVCIEDEADVIDLLRLIVSRQGYEFVEARGGKDGIRVVEQIKPDLVLLDLNMPGLDGWDVYDHLQANAETKDIPIIIVTARAQHDQRVTNMRIANAPNLVTKPFGPAELIEVMGRILKTSS